MTLVHPSRSNEEILYTYYYDYYYSAHFNLCRAHGAAGLSPPPPPIICQPP